MTAVELARELEVSERTIYRDVLALSAAGIPVYADMGRHGGYRLVGGYRTRLTGLSRDEAEALFLSGLSGPAKDLGLSDTIAAAQLKVLAALPPTLRDVSARSGQRFHLDAPGWFHDADPPAHVAQLASAVWQDDYVRFRYRRYGADRDPTRLAAPYGLVLKGGDWYLVAQVESDFRTYRVSRIHAVDLAGNSFTRDESFDLAGFWAKSSAEFVESMFVDQVRIRLSRAGLDRLKSIIEPPAANRALRLAEPDGADHVRTELPVESLEIAYGQLLGLGPEVEVLEPAQLRERMTGATSRMAALYR